MFFKVFAQVRSFSQGLAKSGIYRLENVRNQVFYKGEVAPARFGDKVTKHSVFEKELVLDRLLQLSSQV